MRWISPNRVAAVVYVKLCKIDGHGLRVTLLS